jgi:hypothetical protein
MMEAKLAVGPFYTDSIVLLPSSSSITVSVFSMIRTTRAFPPTIPYVYIFSFQRSEPVLCMQTDALEPDFQPKKLSSSIP